MVFKGLTLCADLGYEDKANLALMQIAPGLRIRMRRDLIPVAKHRQAQKEAFGFVYFDISGNEIDDAAAE